MRESEEEPTLSAEEIRYLVAFWREKADKEERSCGWAQAEAIRDCADELENFALEEKS